VETGGFRIFGVTHLGVVVNPLGDFGGNSRLGLQWVGLNPPFKIGFGLSGPEIFFSPPIGWLKLATRGNYFVGPFWVGTPKTKTPWVPNIFTYKNRGAFLGDFYCGSKTKEVFFFHPEVFCVFYHARERCIPIREVDHMSS